jgi:hypothetical protein
MPGEAEPRARFTVVGTDGVDAVGVVGTVTRGAGRGAGLGCGTTGFGTGGTETGTVGVGTVVVGTVGTGSPPPNAAEAPRPARANIVTRAADRIVHVTVFTTLRLRAR